MGIMQNMLENFFRENSKSSQVVMVSLKGAVTKFADNLIGVTIGAMPDLKIPVMHREAAEVTLTEFLNAMKY